MPKSVAPVPVTTRSGLDLPIVSLPQQELLSVHLDDIELLRDALGPGIHYKPIRLDQVFVPALEGPGGHQGPRGPVAARTRRDRGGGRPQRRGRVRNRTSVQTGRKPPASIVRRARMSWTGAAP